MRSLFNRLNSPHGKSLEVLLSGFFRFPLDLRDRPFVVYNWLFPFSYFLGLSFHDCWTDLFT
jgi:hypothetical protein